MFQPPIASIQEFKVFGGRLSVAQGRRVEYRSRGFTILAAHSFASRTRE